MDLPWTGYAESMTPSDPSDPEPDPRQDRIESRAGLLPEERSAGSEDPQAQAEAILAESEERTRDPEGTQRASGQTPDNAD